MLQIVQVHWQANFDKNLKIKTVNLVLSFLIVTFEAIELLKSNRNETLMRRAVRQMNLRLDSNFLQRFQL